MKKLIAVVLMLCLMIPCALADEDWYYPFGFNKETTYDEAVKKLLSMYETPEKRIVRKEDATLLYPVGYSLFDAPLDGIMISKSDKGDNYKYIMIKLEEPYTVNGAIHFLDAITFGKENSKTSLLNIEPNKTNYDLNGNPVTKTFLNDIEGFINDFSDKSKSMKYRVAWEDIMVGLDKTSEEYDINIMFFHPDYYQE